MTYLSIAARLVRQHEGVRHDPYDDATGKRPIALGHITIGVGRNLEARPLTDDEVDYLLANDLRENEKQVRKWLGFHPYTEEPTDDGAVIVTEQHDYFDLLSDTRKAALLDLAHWAYLPGGWPSLRGYLISAIKNNLRHGSYDLYWLSSQELLYKDSSDHSKGPSGIYKISKIRAKELAAIIQTDELPAWAKGEA